MAIKQNCSEFKIALGNRLRQLRISAKLTQENLAVKSGLTRVTIADIEKGAANPSLDGLTRIAGALGYKVADFFSSGVAHQSSYIMQPTNGDLYQPLTEQLTSVSNGMLNIQVAYAKSSGVDLLTAALNTFKKNGGQIRVLAGIDQKNTTAEALYKLMRLCDDLRVIHDNAFAQTYHPKVYIVSTAERAWVAVGSNNLTRGGLCTNYESCHTQILDLTNTSDLLAYQTLTLPLQQYQESNLVMRIAAPDDIRELLYNRLIVTEQQSRQNANHRSDFDSPMTFGHYTVPNIPSASEQVSIPANLFLSDASNDRSGRSGHSETVQEAVQALNDSEITADSLLSLEFSSDVQETYWFEMRASTGGSRNILDLSSSAKLQSGTYPGAQNSQIPGSVTFFGLNPLARNTEKNITIIYNGTAYYPSTIKFAPNNASWRIQLKGEAETGSNSLSQFGRTCFANHILIFHRVTPNHYILETMAERELNTLKAASEFWATNGSSRNSKAFGKIKTGRP